MSMSVNVRAVLYPGLSQRLRWRWRFWWCW